MVISFLMSRHSFTARFWNLVTSHSLEEFDDISFSGNVPQARHQILKAVLFWPYFVLIPSNCVD